MKDSLYTKKSTFSVLKTIIIDFLKIHYMCIPEQGGNDSIAPLLVIPFKDSVSLFTLEFKH